MSNDIRAGRAYVEIAAQGDDDAKSKLDSVKEKLQTIGDSIASVGTKMMEWGGGIYASLSASAKVFGNMAEGMQELAGKASVGVEEMSALGYAAAACNASAEDVSGAIATLNGHLGDAASGGGSAAKTFSDLGLSFAKINALPSGQRFSAVASAVSKIQDPSKRAAAATALLGDSASKLLPMLQRGGKGIEELKQEASDLGQIMTREDVQAAVEFGASLKSLWYATKMISYHLGAAMAPVVREFSGSMKTAATMASKWIKENRGLIVSIASLASGVFTAGAGVWAIGTVMAKAGQVFGWAGTAVKGVWGVMSGASPILAGMLSPIGLVSSAVVGLAMYFVQTAATVADSTTTLSELWTGMSKDFSKAWGSIADSLMSGNLAGAMDVAWAYLKISWTRGINFLLEKWISFRQGFTNIWASAVTFTEKIFHTAWYGLQIAWVDTVGTFKKVFFEFVNSIRSAWEGVQEWLTGSMINAGELFRIYSKDQADAMRQINSSDFSRQRRDRESKADKTRLQLRDEEDPRVKGLRDEYQARMAIADQTASAERVAREKSARDEIASAKSTVAAKEKEFNATLGKVAGDNATKRADRKKWESPNISGAGESMAGKISSQGTFSAYAVSGLGGNRVETLLQEIARNTKNDEKKKERQREREMFSHYG
jgi:hypothetical protein